MKYLKIESEGEIEIEAFTLIGASSKRSDTSKIGYYGSGLKYSIAAMIRNRIGFIIYSGKSEIAVTVVAKEFRNEMYDTIYVNGSATSLTAGMGGKDWDKPFAPIREIYSNALDEDQDAKLEIVDIARGTTGKTSFFIEYNDNVKHFMENVEHYFCNWNPNVLHTNENATLYPISEGSNFRMYRKGILCYENSNINSLFLYNSEHFEINESRVLSDYYNARVRIGAFWRNCTNKTLISKLIKGLSGGNAGYYEHDLYYQSTRMSIDFDQAWHDVCVKSKFVPAEMTSFCSKSDLDDRIVLPDSLLSALYIDFPDLDILGYNKESNSIKYVIDENPSHILLDKVVDAIDLLNKTRYKHRMKDLDIVYANIFDELVLGMAVTGKIILSKKLDSADVSTIAKIIIEENEHNETGWSDCTRLLQNHLFDLYYDELISQK